MKTMFGTDGIRGVAGQKPLDPKTIRAIGVALAHSLKHESGAAKVLLGMDTRESSGWIGATLTAGLMAGWCDGRKRGGDHDAGDCVSGAGAQVFRRGGDLGVA